MKPLHWDQINPFTGTPFTWDDENLFWGEPSYYLEPGDPGFVPYPNMIWPETRKTKKKTHSMKHNSYFPTSIAKQILWLTNYYLKIIQHWATLGITTTERDGTIADARWLVYLLGSFIPALRPFSKSCTDFVNEAMRGDETGGAMTLPVFTAPPLPGADPDEALLPAVVPRDAGALRRIFSLIQVMQETGNYTETIASDLGTIGSDAAAPDLNELKPEIKVLRQGPNVFVDWGWGGNKAHLDMILLQVDRGDGHGFVMLASDTTPGYVDTAAHPTALTQWKYRGIYVVDDVQVGLWSDEASIIVGPGA